MSKIQPLRFNPSAKNLQVRTLQIFDNFPFKKFSIGSHFQRSHRLLCTQGPETDVKPTSEIYKMASAGIDPNQFNSPGAKQVASYLKRNLEAGKFDKLINSVACQETTQSRVQSFIRECGTRGFYIALASLIPANLRRQILRSIPFKGQSVEDILERVDELEIMNSLKKPDPNNLVLEQAAMAIDPEVFNCDEGAKEVAIFIRDALRKGRLELLSGRKVEAAVGGPKKVKTFVQMCIGKGMFFEALASLIEDKDLMEAILKSCNFSCYKAEILSKCGSFKGILFNPKQVNSPEAKWRIRKNKLIKWANETFGQEVQRAKSPNATEEDFKKLSWRHALVYYQREPYIRFTTYCHKIGGMQGEDGWYQALRVVFGLSEDLIFKIKFAGR